MDVFSRFLKAYINKYTFRREKSDFAVAVVKNKVLYRIVQNFKKKNSAEALFSKIKDDNKVIYPQKFSQNTETKRVTWEILLLAARSPENKKTRKTFTDFGIIEEKVEGDWEIVDKFEFIFEETFKVYGYKQRMCILGIIGNIFLPRMTKKSQDYNVYILNNKVYVKGVDTGDSVLILCKNTDESKRLHNYLLDIFFSRGITQFFFRGIQPLTIHVELVKQAAKDANISLSWMRRYSNMP